jgi:hypothetical protein
VSASVWPATFAITIAVTREFTSIDELVEPLMIDWAACWTALFGSTVDADVVATVDMYDSAPGDCLIG